jgi:hypothetical protein
MSHFYFINGPEQKIDTSKKITKKDRFYEKKDPSKHVPGYFELDKTKSQAVDNESKLLVTGLNTKDKTQIVLKDSLNPNDYEINYKNDLKCDDSKTDFYYNNGDVGPGRGFGNLDVSSDIRNGDASRNTTKEFKEHREKQQTFDYQFQWLDKNFQDPNHIVMPIPRGGVQTRKNNQLTVNTMRTMDTQDHYRENDLTKTIQFHY